MVLRDRVLQNVIKSFEKLANSSVVVGLQSEAGQMVVMKGFWTEYGTENFEGWAWMRSAAANDEEKIKKYAARIIKGNIIHNQGEIHSSALGLIGLYMEKSQKDQIKRTTTPALSPYTIAKKNSAKPLIETGQMWQSIRYKIKGDLSE
jgi:hypothetical protein